MARRYINYDHYCEWCGKRIDDGEDYIQDARGRDYCEECWDELGMKEEE